MSQDTRPFTELFQTGTVISVNSTTHTCDILKTEGGMLNNVLILNSVGGLSSTDTSWMGNLRGAVVAYTYIQGSPTIMGTFPIPASPKNPIATSSTKTNSGSDNKATYGGSKKQSYSGGRNTSYQPNDKVLAADGGAELALLSDGGVVLKASPMAQIIMGSIMDFIKVVARELHIISDFGEMKFHHGSTGCTGISITGGSTYGAEAMEGSEPTVHMHFGSVPEAPNSRFGVRVNGVGGDGGYGGIVMGLDGEMKEATSKDYLLSVGNDKRERVEGSSYAEIHDCKSTEIAGHERRLIQGNRSVVTCGNEVWGSGGDMDIQTQGTLTLGGSAICFATHGTSSGTCEFKCSSFNLVKA